MVKTKIDPAKLVLLALQGSASVAGLLVTTEAMVADKPQTTASAIPRWRHGQYGFLGAPAARTVRNLHRLSFQPETRRPRPRQSQREKGAPCMEKHLLEVADGFSWRPRQSAVPRGRYAHTSAPKERPGPGSKARP